MDFALTVPWRETVDITSNEGSLKDVYGRLTLRRRSEEGPKGLLWYSKGYKDDCGGGFPPMFRARLDLDEAEFDRALGCVRGGMSVHTIELDVEDERVQYFGPTDGSWKKWDNEGGHPIEIAEFNIEFGSSEDARLDVEIQETIEAEDAGAGTPPTSRNERQSIPMVVW